LGISDRHHYAWLCGALEAFETATARFAAIGRVQAAPTVWALGAPRIDPVLECIAQALGAGRTRVVLYDKFARGPGVSTGDINALGGLPSDACDVLTLFRGSYFIADPPTFLAEARRVLAPGGLLLVDWLHGLSDAPVLDLRGDPRHGGTSTPFMTTYVDPQLLAEFPAEFDALIRHVNRPPAWANVDEPGRPVPPGERFRRVLGGRPRRNVTRANYLDTCRAELGRADKHLIEPALMEQHFRVLFRHARYFYPYVRKFNLYLLTVLEPVGP